MLLRTLLFALLGTGLLTGLGFAGVSVSMSRGFGSATAPAPPTKTGPEWTIDRRHVAAKFMEYPTRWLNSSRWRTAVG